MPFLIICGQPCSGKSTIAGKVADKLRLHGAQVVVIDESSASVDRDTAFKGDTLITSSIWMAVATNASTLPH